MKRVPKSADIGSMFAQQVKKQKEADERSNLSRITVPVYGDGRCFFTSIVAALYLDLKSCERNCFGLIKEHDLMLSERQMADSLRKHVVDFLRNHEETISEISIDLPYLLDGKVGMRYASLQERLQAMSHVDTYAGNLEMLTTSFLLRTQIKVYSKTGSDFALIAKLPPDNFYKKSIALLYEEDSSSSPGHFNLLIAGDTPAPECFSLETTVSEVFSRMKETVDIEQDHVQFSDIFKQTPCSILRYLPTDPIAKCSSTPDSSNLNSPLNPLQEQHVDNAVPEPETTLIPDVCSDEQFQRWKVNRTWLLPKKLTLSRTGVGVSCETCAKTGSLSACLSTSEKISVSTEWVNGVTAKNSKKLLDKISDHQKSFAHNACVRELDHRASNLISVALKKSDNLWKLQHAESIDITSRVFRTAYVVARKHLSFSVHRQLVQLQEQNGLKMGKMLFSHNSCHNLIEFIATEMRKRLLEFVIQSNEPFSLMMDESTTMANETALIVYLRTADPAGKKKKTYILLYFQIVYVCIIQNLSRAESKV